MIVLLASLLLHPPQTDWGFYQWCNDNLGQGDTYCCAQAGGIWKSGVCVDSQTGHVPWFCPGDYRICSPPSDTRQGT